MGEVKKNRSSGSEKRQATTQLSMRFTPAQHAALAKLAEERGQSLPALLLNALLSIPPPRARRPRVDDDLMRQFFTEIARARDALKPHEAELGKSGSNLNQIAHVLNTDRAPESVMNILESTLEEHFEVLQHLDQAIRDLLELRTAGMNAMGLELRHGADDAEEPRRKAPGVAARKPVAKAG